MGPNGTVRVDLYSIDMPIEEIRERQRAFRDWMGYDEIEERAPELRGLVTADPHVELEEGEFDHGGVRRVVEWLDADLESIRRSAASQRRVTELGEDGSVLRSVVETIDS